MINKKAYAIQMTYDVSDKEKSDAEKALYAFNFLVKNIKNCENHLDIIYTSFKGKTNEDPKSIYNSRAALRSYRDKVVDNFNEFKKYAFQCFTLMKPFSSDTQTIKIMKSFTMAIEDIEKQVNYFVDLFNKLDDPDLIENILKFVDSVKKEIFQFVQIVEERIINHLQRNILGRNWIDNVSKELQVGVENKIPLMVQLMKDRNENVK